MSILEWQCNELREKADELRHVHVDDASMGLLFAAMGAMREAADTIESLRDRLQNADVAYNDAEVLGDVTQGLFRDLLAADPDTAKLWARSWPELFGEKEVER